MSCQPYVVHAQPLKLESDGGGGVAVVEVEEKMHCTKLSFVCRRRTSEGSSHLD